MIQNQLSAKGFVILAPGALKLKGNKLERLPVTSHFKKTLMGISKDLKILCFSLYTLLE